MSRRKVKALEKATANPYQTVPDGWSADSWAGELRRRSGIVRNRSIAAQMVAAAEALEAQIKAQADDAYRPPDVFEGPP